MTREEMQSGAKSLLEFPVFHELMAEMENNALDKAVTAPPTKEGDDTRRNLLAEVRVIRELKSRLELLGKESQQKPKTVV